MIIKPSGGRTHDIETLAALARRPDIAQRTRDDIEREIRQIRAGECGEREAAYEIDFHHGSSRNWAVIHDLRIEHEGRVAQIDHLLIGRFLDIWVCETKHFSGGVAINEQGEFTCFVGGRPQAVPSPVEQNRKHLAVLDSVLRSDKVALPTRLGFTIRPHLHAVVLVGRKARITRPTTRTDGLDTIVKSDQLRALIERSIDDESAVSTLMTAGKLVAAETLEAFGRQLARLHRPLRRDWAARFAIAPDAARSERTIADRVDHAAPKRLPSAMPVPPATTGLSVASSPATTRDALLPTSKLGAAMGLKNLEETLTRLTNASLLEVVDGSPRLTAAGIAAGGRFVAKSRFGPYFLWPKDLRC